VTRRGYEFAAKQPEEAARVFLAAVPKGTFENDELVTRSTKALAPIYVDASGRWGLQDATKWDAYSTWLLGQGVVTDASNKVVTGNLPHGALFTNELLQDRSALAP
jgi:NitT/TauT family transport system substrate-binding protein